MFVKTLQPLLYLRGCHGVWAASVRLVNQMHVKDAAHLPVEIHSASLDTVSEESARVYIDNRAG
jgi:hypothetical protein